MTTMRAVQVVGYHQNLEMKEVPVPRPPGRSTSSCGSVERACAAPTCTSSRASGPRSPVHAPTRSGTRTRVVHAVGSEVTNVKEGDKVIVHRSSRAACAARRSGDDVHCESNQFPGIDTNGGYAEYLRTSARSVAHRRLARAEGRRGARGCRPHGLPRCGRRPGRLTPRDRVVVIGAGGPGHIGIQGLKALTPAEIIVVDRNPDALKLALSIGADHGVVAEGNQVEEVLELTDGHGAEVVVDFVGGAARRPRCRDAAAGRRLPRRRLRREHRRADDRHHLDRDQLHRQPRRLLQRPPVAHGAGRSRST